MSALADGRTLAPLGRRLAEVTSHRRVGAYDVIACDDPDGPAPDPGQFYMLAAAEGWGGGEGERPFLPRAFSVMRRRDDGAPAPGAPAEAAGREEGAPAPAAPAEAAGREEGAPALEFLLEAVGPGTARLAELRPGDGLWILGPLGRGFAPAREGREPVLAGGGVGIAPLAIWADSLRAAGDDPVVLLGFRDEAHAGGAALIEGARVATDDGSAGRRALVTELLRDELLLNPHAEVYACGPPPMLEAVRALCEELAVPAQLALESGMACGYGACFGCVVPTREGYVRLCVDGPVLGAAELETALVAGAGH